MKSFVILKSGNRKAANNALENTGSRIENIADEFDIVLFSGLVMCVSPVSDS